MAPRREILDSEDDGSDFGDAPEAELASGKEHYETIGASHNVDASIDSTDPSFFQRIYDQQHAATDMQDVIPDTAPVEHAASAWTNISSAPPPGQKLLANDYSSLTPLTDPVPGSRKPKRAREVSQSEVIDLTNITTPRKETSDVWDVPTSARSQRSTRAYGKRKGAQLSMEEEAPHLTLLDTQDPYAFPDATPPARVNRRGSSSSLTQQAHDSSPVMLIPTEAPTSSDRRTRSSRKKKASFDAESTMPDTAVPSLYITQSTLTASQKEQYRAICPSSEGMPPEASEPSFAGQSLDVGEMYKSSATTVAYPTPSRVASTARLPEVAEEAGEDAVAGTLPSYDVGFQQSSPDVLTDMTATASSRSKRSRAKVVSPAGLDSFELESPAPTRRAKKRKVVREVEDDSWERDPLGGTQENNDPPQQDAQAQSEAGDTNYSIAQPAADMVAPAFLPEAEPIDIEAMEVPAEVPATTPKPTAKNKRGRKKKGVKTQEPALEPNEPTQAAEAEPESVSGTAEVTEPPAKRKRGRPRKSEVPKPQPEPENEPEQQPYEEAGLEAEANTALQPLSEMDRNSKPSPEVPAADVEDGAVEDSKENDPAVVKDAVAKDKSTEKEKQAAKDVKSGPQKVQYRVGLSKRSRIAPLLKCLKKPD
ncbi:uncharacterized protein B0H64DRAFT_476882 [Chaetomium fimeti]|uniref:AT hook domain-containing protein n=1 Tax=Chaetomium fimeti TaxID=1854472 RepID=A0AAE0HBD1_9PEZI|nr:hypothetical protein B0H64DRAFT_476882 [Chaetomium fimeti]